MSAKLTKDRHVFEIMLIILAIGMTYLFYRMGGYKMVILNLYFLPVVLSGYYLGRSHAGVLALFCAISVSIAATLDVAGFASFSTPIIAGLAVTVWAAVLGLTALLVGTLCDERAAKLVGVNPVSVYLQTYFLSGALAGAAGVLVGLAFGNISHIMGEQRLLYGFVIIILGGLGSIRGALMASFVFGMMQTLTIAYLSTGLSDAIIFLALFLILLFRPHGLMGKEEAGALRGRR